MTISVRLEASIINGHKTFSLDDIGVSENEWSEMSDSEKHEAIENAVFDLPEQPYWAVVSFEEQ